MKNLIRPRTIVILNTICLLAPSVFADAKNPARYRQNVKWSAPAAPVKPLTTSIVLPADVNLYDQADIDTQNRSLDSKSIQAQNQRIFDGLALMKPRDVAGRIGLVSATDVQTILTASQRDEVAGSHGGGKYDPKRNIGFCFGRAMYVHLNLLSRKVNKDSILKAFLIGPMQAGDITWGFHVATIVHADDGRWLVVDPNFGHLMDVQEWFNYYQGYDSDKKLRLFVTTPNKFGASSSGYQPGALNDPFYNGYFRDMLSIYRENALLKLDPRMTSRPRLCSSLF